MSDTYILSLFEPFGDTSYFARMNKGKWDMWPRAGAGFMWECDFFCFSWEIYFKPFHSHFLKLKVKSEGLLFPTTFQVIITGEETI